MTIARKIDRGVLVATSVALALPAVAEANPLLSGYGAPGQGGQVLLGSTLTQSRGGGGHAAAGDGTSVSGIEAPQANAGANTSSHTQGTPPAADHGTRSARSHHKTSSAATGSPPSGGGPTQTGLEPARSVHTDTAGLSSGDLALILLGVGVIAATAVLMARLARGQEREGGGSQQ